MKNESKGKSELNKKTKPVPSFTIEKTKLSTTTTFRNKPKVFKPITLYNDASGKRGYVWVARGTHKFLRTLTTTSKWNKP